MSASVVFVHGIRTSATMWRPQLEYLRAKGVRAAAVDLPAHGSRMHAQFTLDGALDTIDQAVRASDHPVVLVGHSMGGLLSLSYAGTDPGRSLGALVAASCTAFPAGLPLRAYRMLAKAFDSLPDRGMWLTTRVLEATIPEEGRGDFGAGGYALDAQDGTLAALAGLDLRTAVPRISVPLWFVNGQFDQLRANESEFTRMAPEAELIVIPRTSHLVPAMRPDVFNALVDVAIATVESRVAQADRLRY